MKKIGGAVRSYLLYGTANPVNFHPNWAGLAVLFKGQIISKANLSSRGFFKKTNENTSHTSKNELICSFFGRIHGLTICF